MNVTSDCFISAATVRKISRYCLLIAFAAAMGSQVQAQTPASPAAARESRSKLFQTPAVAKAAPFKRESVCDIYGAGFVSVPGTTTCIKLGGAMRLDATINR